MARSNATKLKSNITKMKLTLLDISNRKIGVELGVSILKNQISTVGILLAECGSMNQVKLLGEFAIDLQKVDQKLVDNREEMDKGKRGQTELQDLRRDVETLLENGLFSTVGIS